MHSIVIAGAARPNTPLRARRTSIATASAAVATSLLLLSAPAMAQTASAAKATTPATTTHNQLPEVTITGNPLGTTDLIAPADRAQNRALKLGKSDPTLS